MKYLMLAIIFSIIVSCAPFGINIEGYEVLSEPLEVAWPKSAALKYIPDTNPDDQWKSPHETIKDGGGDCEDIAVVLLYYLGPESQLVEIKMGTILHCIVKYRGKYIEAQSVGAYYDPSQLNIIDIFSYNSVMETTTHWGTQSIIMN